MSASSRKARRARRLEALIRAREARAFGRGRAEGVASERAKLTTLHDDVDMMTWLGPRPESLYVRVQRPKRFDVGALLSAGSDHLFDPRFDGLELATFEAHEVRLVAKPLPGEPPWGVRWCAWRQVS